MGNSSSTNTPPTPPITPKSRIEKISTSLDKKQSVAMFGKDISVPKSNFSFWLCSVNEKGRNVMSDDNNNSSSSERPASSDDSLLSCCGTDTDEGDIKFWMINDYEKKYQVRPASQEEVNSYVEQGQKTQGKYYTASKLPFFLFHYPEKKNEDKDNKNKSPASAAFTLPEYEVRNTLLKNSGIHPYMSKDEENKYGVYGVRVIRDYGAHAEKALERAMKK